MPTIIRFSRGQLGVVNRLSADQKLDVWIWSKPVGKSTKKREIVLEKVDLDMALAILKNRGTQESSTYAALIPVLEFLKKYAVEKAMLVDLN